tara:strand:- start:1064 stop:2467 length:1404 start_codon:yes stop_codon:yes gene_type:complete
MALNPFFLHGSSGEQNLIQDLVNEQLKMFGVEIYYIPRVYVNEKTVMEEVSRSEFSAAIPLEAYVDTYEGFSGAGTLLSKFGVQEVDDLTLIISKERYESVVQQQIATIDKTKLTTRPKEGDLVYFPLGDRLFEIKYVEHEKPFWQLQKNYVYELRLELFAYNDEEIDTGISEIDDNVIDAGYIQTFNMVGVGSTATAITSLIPDGAVRNIIVSRRGASYESIPRVAITSAPSGGVTAVGIASMIDGIVDLCEPSPDKGRVQRIEIANPGSGYTVAPRVTFHGGGGSGAFAIAQLADDAVGIITITSGGSGYIGIPTVTVVAPGIASTTIDAKVRARINTLGQVTALIVDDAGGYFEGVPEIRIAGPTQNVGYGTYLTNEDVIGSASSATARVNSWNAVTQVLKLKDITGEFISGESIIGQSSGAAYANIDLNKFNIPEDGFAQNNTIELEADKILDFSESNPFGNP